MAVEARSRRPVAVPTGLLDAVALRDRLAAGELGAVELAESCLARTDEVEDEVRAWTFIDRGHVLGGRTSHLRWRFDRRDALRRATVRRCSSVGRAPHL